MTKKPYMDLSDYPKMVESPGSPQRGSPGRSNDRIYTPATTPGISPQARIFTGVTTAVSKFLGARKQKYALSAQHRATSLPGLNNGAIKATMPLQLGGRGVRMTMCQVRMALKFDWNC
jgi:hypothetical protein